MAVTYDKIATTTLGAAASTIDFTSIPGTYTDLILVTTLKVTSSAYDLYIRCNSDSGTNYSYTVLTGNGTSAQSARGSSISDGLLADYYGNPNTTFDTICISHIMNYANSTTYKTMISRANRASSGTDAVVSLWRSTAAITTLTLRNTSTTWTSGSIATLYGVKAF